MPAGVSPLPVTIDTDALPDMPHTTTSTEVEPNVLWLLPSSAVKPADALSRIRIICERTPDLFSALWIVMATHQQVSREVLSVAIKQSRTDLASLSHEDVQSLLISMLNGGQPGFDAVLRARLKSKRQGGHGGGALPWNT